MEVRVIRLPAIAMLLALHQFSAFSQAFSNTSMDLIGLWSGEGEMIEFKADGNCRYNGTLLPYRATNGRLILETTVGDVVFEYTFLEGKLILKAGGTQSVYSRPAAGTAQSSVKEKHPHDLIGQWCYMNLTTNSQSKRCITFREDGTYSYSAESAQSVGANDTPFQGSHAGTWYAEGSRIYYQSPAAGTGSYLLEKRNHPKNVNDPMIVLDGEPFVTTTARPPWR